MPPVTSASDHAVYQPDPFPAEETPKPEKSGDSTVAREKILSPNPVLLSNETVDVWIAGIEKKLQQERTYLISAGRLMEKNGLITVNLTTSEKFVRLLRSSVDAIAGLLGRKEQSVLSGYSAVSALVRGATPALKQLGSARGFGITGLVLTSAYLATTSVNLATAVSAYAKSCATQSEHFEWILNNFSEVKQFLREQHNATLEQAEKVNEFMLRVENVTALMSTVRLREEANQHALIREGAAMLPGGIISEASSINAFTETIPAFASGVLSEAAAGFQVLGGVLDIKQSLTEKDIVRLNIAETGAKINALKKLEQNNPSEIIKGFVTAFRVLHESVIGDHESQWLNTDFRLFKGSMAIPAGVAGATFTALLIAKTLGVFVLASAAITLTLTALSALSGVILLAFLGRFAYVAFRGWQSAEKSLVMAEKARKCVSSLSSINTSNGMVEFFDWNELNSNPYLRLDQFAKILVKGKADAPFEKKFNIPQEEAMKIMNAVGIPDFYLKSLLLEAKGRGESGVEWFKAKIGKYLNIDYSFTEEPTVSSVSSEKSSNSGEENALRFHASHRALI